MAEEVKKARHEHKIIIAGKLKATELATKKGQQGTDYITGKMTIATDLDHSYSVRVFINSTRYNGEANKSYADACNLLLSRTPTSMKSLLDANSTMTAQQAFDNALKVYAFGRFEDWETETGELRVSIVCDKIGISDSPKFTYKAQFEVDAFIEQKGALMNEEGEEEGIKIMGIIPTGGDKNPSCVKVPFISREADIVSHIEDNWNVGDTVHITGDLENVRITVATESPKQFGRPRDERATSKFIDERLIKGGSTEGYDEDSDLYLKKDDIQKRLTNRQVRFDEQKQKADAPKEVGNSQFGFSMNAKPAADDNGLRF